MNIMIVWGTELSKNLLLRRNFSDAEDLAKQYGGRIYKHGMRWSRLPTFYTVYNFLRFFAWVKNVLPIFHFIMLTGLPLVCMNISLCMFGSRMLFLCFIERWSNYWKIWYQHKATSSRCMFKILFTSLYKFK